VSVDSIITSLAYAREIAQRHRALARSLADDLAALEDQISSRMLPAVLTSVDAARPAILERVADQVTSGPGSDNGSAATDAEAVTPPPPSAPEPRHVFATWAAQTQAYTQAPPSTAPNPDVPLRVDAGSPSPLDSTASLFADGWLQQSAIVAGLCLPSTVTRATTDTNFPQANGSGGASSPYTGAADASLEHTPSYFKAVSNLADARVAYKTFQQELAHLAPTPMGRMAVNGIRMAGAVAGVSATADEAKSALGFVGSTAVDYGVATAAEFVGAAAAVGVADALMSVGLVAAFANPIGAIIGVALVVGGSTLVSAYLGGVLESTGESVVEWYWELEAGFRRPYGIEYTFDPP
jgi:hypothetical protein